MTTYLVPGRLLRSATVEQSSDTGLTPAPFASGACRCVSSRISKAAGSRLEVISGRGSQTSSKGGIH
jgi:hypothetical protein